MKKRPSFITIQPVFFQSGLSLIEIMIAITISSILLAGVGQIYLSNKQTYRTTEAVSRLQENARFAINFISKSIREADHWGCAGSWTQVADPSNLVASYGGITGAISALNDQSETGVVVSDRVRLVGAAQDGTSVVSAAAGSATITLDNISDFKVGDNIVINNCLFAQMGTITGISSNTLTLGNTLNQSYAGNAMIHKLNQATYSLALNSSGVPALFMNDGTSNMELIEGVENMQLLMGGDSDGDRVADFYVAPGTAGLNMENVVSVKIVLSIRTIADNIAVQNRTYNGVTDRRISKDYSATIALRNRLN